MEDNRKVIDDVASWIRLISATLDALDKFERFLERRNQTKIRDKVQRLYLAGEMSEKAYHRLSHDD